MAYDNLTDEQLARDINARIAELKTRTKRQAEEMVARHKRLLLEATSQDSDKKRPGRKPKEKKEKADAVAA